MNKSLKVFIACFLGAGIGTLTALQLNGYFWWLGLLAGGLVGYLSYEFKKVRRAVPKAWQVVVGTQFYPRNFVKACLSGISVGSWMGVGFGLLGFTEDITVAASIFTCLSFMGIVMGFILGSIFGFSKEMSKTDKKISEDIWKYNPVYFGFYYLPVWLVKGTIYIVPRAPGFIWKALITLSQVAIILARFTKTLFIMIHSEIRLLCGIDAAIGATIGYFAGNVIIGAISGGAIGLLNYEILSKRILHLVPSKTNNA